MNREFGDEFLDIKPKVLSIHTKEKSHNLNLIQI